MRKVPPGVTELALRSLRSRVPDGNAPCAAPWSHFGQRCDALCARLTPLVGREGSGTLLSRALARAKGDHPWLGGVEVDPKGSLSGLEAVLSSREAAEGEAASAAILAHFLGLLTAMVGAGLTRQLVSSAWPDLLVRDADFGVEEDEG